MKYLKMFFESLRMAKALDNSHFTYDSKRCAEMIDTLSPPDDANRRPAADPYRGSGRSPSPKPA